jgi:hypothetical protein
VVELCIPVRSGLLLDGYLRIGLLLEWLLLGRNEEIDWVLGLTPPGGNLLAQTIGFVEHFASVERDSRVLLL